MKRLAWPFLAVFFLSVIARADEPDSFEKRFAAVLPREGEEKWLKVPWRKDLAQARIDANEAGKPIFLWLMDGDPLGCT